MGALEGSGVGPAGRLSFLIMCSAAYLTACSKLTRQSVCYCDTCVIETPGGCTLSGQCQVLQHSISEHPPCWGYMTPGCRLTFIYLLQEAIHCEDTRSCLLV